MLDFSRLCFIALGPQKCLVISEPATRKMNHLQFCQERIVMTAPGQHVRNMFMAPKSQTKINLKTFYSLGIGWRKAQNLQSNTLFFGRFMCLKLSLCAADLGQVVAVHLFRLKNQCYQFCWCLSGLWPCSHHSVTIIPESDTTDFAKGGAI